MTKQPDNPEPAHSTVDAMLSRKFGKEVANYFSGSPLNRVGFLRGDHKFLTQALKPAIDAVERHWRENWRVGIAKKDEKLTHGAVVLVGNRKQDKFFSNGAAHVVLLRPCGCAANWVDADTFRMWWL